MENQLVANQLKSLIEYSSMISHNVDTYHQFLKNWGKESAKWVKIYLKWGIDNFNTVIKFLKSYNTYFKTLKTIKVGDIDDAKKIKKSMQNIIEKVKGYDLISYQ